MHIVRDREFTKAFCAILESEKIEFRELQQP
jgi:hypothetical protein